MTYYLPCLADLGYDAGVVDRIVPGVLLNLSITPPPPRALWGQTIWIECRVIFAVVPALI